MRMLSGLAALAVTGVFLAGCAEKPQNMVGTGGNYSGKPDTAAWDAAPTSYSAGGYETGDRAGWHKALKARADNQNEYTRVR
jgi:hypothetical protein